MRTLLRGLAALFPTVHLRFGLRHGTALTVGFQNGLSVFEHKRRVVVEVSVVGAAAPVMHKDQTVAGAAKEVPVVRDEKQCPLKLRKRHRKRLARCHIQVVCGFVKNE